MEWDPIRFEQEVEPRRSQGGAKERQGSSHDSELRTTRSTEHKHQRCQLTCVAPFRDLSFAPAANPIPCVQYVPWGKILSEFHHGERRGHGDKLFNRERINPD